ncbi:MAG: BPSS1780 family membrane protein [Caldimonas sp.]
MKFLRVPPAEGVAWVRRAFQAFFRQPFGFAGLFAACALVFFGLVRIPLAGEAILIVLVPIGTLLFMIAARRSAAGERPLPGAFAELLAAPRGRLIELLKLGIAYLVAALAAVLIVAAVEGNSLTAFMEVVANPKSTPEASAASLADPRLQLGFLVRLLLGALLSVPFWHAPGLVWWGGQGWAKALFFSTVAIWRNKGAFTMYGLVWAGLVLVLAMLLGVVVALLGGQQARFAATSLFFFFSTVLYVSLWFTFAGCFAQADDDAGADAGATSPAEPPSGPDPSS